MSPPRSLKLSREQRAAVTRRFRGKVSRAPGGCWFWTASRDHDGRGWFRLPISVWPYPMNAQRAAWLLFRGTIPEEHDLTSTCGDRSCVNPDHLATKTREQLARIYGATRRAAAAKRRGVNNHNAKLTEGKVRTLVRLWNNGWNARQLAARYRVSKPLISAVTNGWCWGYLNLWQTARRGA